MRTQTYRIAVQLLAFNSIVWFLFDSFFPKESGFEELTLVIYIIFISITSASGIAALYVGVELYLKKLQQIEDMDAKKRYGMYLINSLCVLIIVMAALFTFPLNPTRVVYPLPFFSALAAIAGIYILIQGFLQRKKTPLIQEEVVPKSDKYLIYLGLANLIFVLPGTFLSIQGYEGILGLFFAPSFFVTPFVLIIDIVYLTLYLRRHKPENKKKKIIIGLLILSIGLFFWLSSSSLR